MWPVQRGDIPIDNKTGLSKVVNDYKLWRSDLIERIGDYCSYCNIPLSHARQVEHVVAKSTGGALTDWNNLLLACGPCNLAKSDKQCPPTTHYLPDYHNTHIAFSYIEKTFKRKGKIHSACIVDSSSNAPDIPKSRNTISLLELDRLTYESKAVDRRWESRYKVLLSARTARSLWDELVNDPQRLLFEQDLKNRILAEGFFSIWYIVFEDVPQVRQLIVESVQGTHPNAFPAPNYLPVPLHPPDL
jgi:HNH endonuclease